MGSFLSRLRERLLPGQISLDMQSPESPDERRTSIEKWWAYYHGTHPVTGNTQWSYLYRRFETMPRRDIEDFENHTRICTDRLRRLLVNSWRGFECTDESAAPLLRTLFERNRWSHLLHLIVLSGKVTGDAFIKLIPTGSENPADAVRLVLLDSETVELEVSPHDRDEVVTATVSYDFFEHDTDGCTNRRTYREIIDHTSVTAFIDDVYAPEFSYDHDLGFMPLVHVRNSDTGGGIYGESLVARLTEAQDALNLLTSDLMDIVRYDGHKTTIFQNVAIDKGASRDGRTSGEVDLSIGKGLVVKGEGRVYKLDQQHDLGAALQEYDRKVDVLYDLAGVPRLSRELLSHLGNLSGRTIERLYQDAIESTRESQLLYGGAFTELARKAASMAGLGDIHAEALWNTDVISPDIETLAKELSAGVRSKTSAMRKLGINDTDRMQTEIAQEQS